MATCKNCKEECKAEACCLNEDEWTAWCGCGLDGGDEKWEIG